MQFPKARIIFDNGDVFEYQNRSRDMVKAEADGHDFQTMGNARAAYVAALMALRRMEKAGTITPSEPLPATVDDLTEVADIEEDEDDPEGEGSGQAASTG